KISNKDVSLSAVEALDQPIHEFMAWMQENAAKISAGAELALLAQHSYIMAKCQEQKIAMINLSTSLPEEIKLVGDKYLKLAQEAFAELHPPKNNRMDYLVH
ncbi:MAG: hypothetical protein AABY26_07160, partial [Nanoarchaeota archaeon]